MTCLRPAVATIQSVTHVCTLAYAWAHTGLSYSKAWQTSLPAGWTDSCEWLCHCTLHGLQDAVPSLSTASLLCVVRTVSHELAEAL